MACIYLHVLTRAVCGGSFLFFSCLLATAQEATEECIIPWVIGENWISHCVRMCGFDVCLLCRTEIAMHKELSDGPAVAGHPYMYQIGPPLCIRRPTTCPTTLDRLGLEGPHCILNLAFNTNPILIPPYS